MTQNRRAVIDIGTNSVKLLVADVSGSSVSPVWEESEQTRLGRGFYETHLLSAEAIQETAAAVRRFVTVAQANGVAGTRVIATSAARDAKNQADLLSAIRQTAGVEVEIISGAQEADLAYQGVRSDAQLEGVRLLILDVGGGSSEFILGDNSHPEFAQSFPLGSVRLLEMLRPTDPPERAQLERCREHLRSLFAEQIRPTIVPVLERRRDGTQLVGTGGAATILARMEYRLKSYERAAIEGARISLESIRAWIDRLWAMPLDERKRIVGLPKKRADVILTGMCIYEAVLHELGFTEMRVSTRGLRFAAVLQTHRDCVAA